MVMPREEVACPACGEMILAIAKKCKYCGEWRSYQARDSLTPGSRFSGDGHAIATPHSLAPRPSSLAKDISQLSPDGLATIRAASERVVVRCLECGYGGEAGVVAGSHRRNWLWLILIVPASIVAGSTVTTWSLGTIDPYSPYGPLSTGAALFYLAVLLFFTITAGILLARILMPPQRQALCPSCRNRIGPV